MKELYSKGKIPGHEDTGEIVPSCSQPSEASEYDSTDTSGDINNIDENKVVHNIERRYLPDSSRPIYTVLGQTIAFRSAGEVPCIHSACFTDDIYNNPSDSSSVANEKRELINSMLKSRESEILVATNNPEGILTLAKKLTGGSAEIDTILEDIKNGGPYGDEVKEFTDKIIACTMFDDRGNTLTDRVDENGYAIVLAAICGDEDAASLVSSRLDVMRETIKQRQEIIRYECDTEAAIQARRMEEAGLSEIEPKDVTLVHSTRYEVQRNSDGEVCLYPASRHESRSMRSSIHFTPNGQVSSHAYGSWSDTNRLIVANMERVISSNGIPAAMASADTYFTRSPGDSLVLPGALVVEPKEMLSDQGQVIEEDETGVKYLSTDSYTSDQKEFIKQAAETFGVKFNNEHPSSTLREVALRTVEKQLGATSFTEIGQNYASDTSFDQQITQLSLRLGCPSRSHMASQEMAMESMRAGFCSEDEWSGPIAPASGFLGSGMGWSIPDNVSNIDSLRTMVFAGALPALDLTAVKEHRNKKIGWSAMEY